MLFRGLTLLRTYVGAKPASFGPESRFGFWSRRDDWALRSKPYWRRIPPSGPGSTRTKHPTSGGSGSCQASTCRRLPPTQGRILLSHNRRHFLQLHRHRMENHAGIVLCTVDSDFGGQAQRIHAAVANVSDMRNQLIRVTHLRRGQRFVELFFLSLDGFGGGFDEFAGPVGPCPEERGGGTEASGDEANIAGVDVFGGDRGGSEREQHGDLQHAFDGGEDAAAVVVGHVGQQHVAVQYVVGAHSDA
jgi:hypothetical protein